MLTFYKNIITKLGCFMASVFPPITQRLALYLPCLSYRIAIGTKDECGRRRLLLLLFLLLYL